MASFVVINSVLFSLFSMIYISLAVILVSHFVSEFRPQVNFKTAD